MGCLIPRQLFFHVLFSIGYTTPMKMILTIKELDQLKDLVGNETCLLHDESRNFFTALGDQEYLLSFHWLDEKKVTVYATPSLFMLYTDSQTVRGYGQSVSDENDGILQFHQFLLELTASDIYRLESLENMIISLEDRLFLDASPTAAGIKDIIKVRKDLLKAKRYYEQMEFLSDEMSAVDPAFGFIDKKFDRLMTFVMHLQTYIESVREAYQSQIDIEQNNIMKFFTVVTTIFTPLTLITGWYGMNFKMPEYNWPLGYVFVSSLAFSVVLGLIILFRRKKWF